MACGQQLHSCCILRCFSPKSQNTLARRRAGCKVGWTGQGILSGGSWRRVRPAATRPPADRTLPQRTPGTCIRAEVTASCAILQPTARGTAKSGATAQG